LDLPETRPDRGVFAEIVDNFASHVQDAFNEADRSMEREKSDLRERYQYLLQELKHAREKRNLGPSDQKRLDDELENVDTNRLRVKDCLACHHSWHEGHDALEKVECFRETNRFQRELNLYCGTPLEKLLSLIDHELEQAGARDLEGGPPIKGVIGAGARRQDPSQTSTNQHIRDAFVDDLSYLKKLLEALRRGADADLFDKVRRPFDDAFYFVDKRTLREVEQAEERVVKLEDWLDGLAAREKKCSGTPPR
jgi:hypothetical protein